MVTRLLVGDCRDLLPTLPAQSVHCVVTSPPYFGLRDYGTADWDGGDVGCDHRVKNPEVDQRTSTLGPNGTGLSIENAAYQYGKVYRDTCGKCGAVRVDRQIGLESSLEDYITTLVEVFREVRRVMRDDASLWLNLGDSYAGSWGNQGRKTERGTQRPINGPMLTPVLDGRYPSNGHNTGKITDAYLKPKDLMMVPARVALALQADGWYLRSDIIWAKKAPMPESVTDRPTSAHEHVFLLTKQARYFYDAEAVKEQSESDHGSGNGYKREPRLTYNGRGSDEPYTVQPTRNLRNVWHLGPSPFPEAHFATFPPALVEPCIKAGTSERGCCAACGAPWVRVLARSVAYGSGSGKSGNVPNGKYAGTTQAESGDYDIRMGPQVSTQTLGWQPGCSCAADVIPCTVLDPFAGSGTTGLVADRLGRDSILIELNPAYAAMSRDRITNDAPLFTTVLL